MDTDMLDSGSFQNTVVRPVQIAWIHRLSLGVGEHIIEADVYLFQFQQGV